MNNIVVLNHQEVSAVCGGLPFSYFFKVFGAMVTVKCALPYLQRVAGYLPNTPYTNLAFLGIECATILFGADVGERIGMTVASSMPSWIRKHLD